MPIAQGKSVDAVMLGAFKLHSTTTMPPRMQREMTVVKKGITLVSLQLQCSITLIPQHSGGP